MNPKEIFAQRLKTARAVQGLSLRKLADMLGFSHNTIHKYEKGEVLPNSKGLIQIAKILKQPVDFFSRPVAVQLENIEFRKKSSLGKVKITQIQNEAEDYFERYQFLEESLGINTSFVNPLEHLQVNTSDDAETAAMMLRDKWKLGQDSIVNVLELLESEFFKILLLDTHEKLDGFSGYRGSNPVIVLNKRYSVDRLRFTALHEVGHLLLNLAPLFLPKEQEKICHRFAGAMLMPKDIFSREFGGYRVRLAAKELIEIKEEYGISIAAIISRARDLELIPEAVYKTFWVKYNQLGWKQAEPGVFGVRETSNRFEQLLQRAAAMETLTLSKCASLARRTLVEFRKEIEFMP